MTFAQDVQRHTAEAKNKLDWTQKLLIERLVAQAKAKRQRDNAHRALAQHRDASGTPFPQLVTAVRLADIELMGAVDAANAAFAEVFTEWLKEVPS